MKKKKKAPAPAIPKGYDKGDTSYKLTVETYYYPKPKPLKRSRATAKAAKPAPMEVKVVNRVKVQGGKKG